MLNKVLEKCLVFLLLSDDVCMPSEDPASLNSSSDPPCMSLCISFIKDLFD